MADRNTTIRASQLRNFSITAEDLKTNSITGLKFIDGTISGSKIADEAISEPKLDISNVPIDGYYLKYTTASGMRWFASGGGVSDHGALTGLADDDHTQYILVDGTRSFTGTISGITPTVSGHLATKDYVDSMSSLPTGSIMAWMTSTLPTGWLECDGSAVSKTTYSNLYTVISGTYGESGDNFNLPDLRGEFLRGYDHGATNDPDAASRTDRGDGTTGDNVGTKQVDEFKSHRHRPMTGTSTTDWTSLGVHYSGTGKTWNNNNPIELTGGNETRPRNINVMWCIKYTTAALGLTTDHGDLTGLADDDHTQYLLADGTRNISGNILQNDGLYIATAEVRATSVSGLALKDDSGTLGIFIEDGGKVGIGGMTNPVNALDIKSTQGFWNSGETRGLTQAWQANYVDWAYYNGSGWTYPMVMSDLKANLFVGFMDGWVGLANIKTNYIEAYAGTDINEFSTDTTLGGNSDNAVPTEKAVKAYVDGLFGAGGQIKHAVIKTGTYTGDGSTSKAITGVGFQPKYVIIWVHPAAEAMYGGTWSTFRKLDQSWGQYAEVEAGTNAGPCHDRLISLDADGFTVDDDAGNWHPNKLSQVYDYIAIGEETSIVVGDVASANSTVAMVETGTYMGDGSTSKVISLADSDLTPKFVRIVLDPTSEATDGAIYEKVDEYGIYTHYHSNTSGHGHLDNRINSFAKGSFTVDDDGADYHPNANGVTYNYVVFGTKTITAVAATNVPSYVKVSDVKSSGTNGGTFTTGAWRTRTLNTKDSDPDGVCSLSSNQITLAAGTYECRIMAPAHKVNNNKARLRNVTAGTTILIGTSEFTPNTVSITKHAMVVGRFTIAASQALEVQHRAQTTQNGNGFGPANSFGVDEVYAIAEFWKVG